MQAMSLGALQLQDTRIFKQLSKQCRDTSFSGLPGNVQAIADEAAAWLKRFPHRHPEFTLHDEVHCVRVVYLMGNVLGDQVSSLNACECALLILSAYFHDIGMVPDDAKINQIKDTPEWREHEGTWAQEHPNYGSIQSLLQNQQISQVDRGRAEDRLVQLRAAMLTDYLRPLHAQLSAEHFIEHYAADQRLKLQNVSMAESIARLCRSHTETAASLTADNGFHLDELLGTFSINTQRLAFVLRLADILDFDRDRTPDSLYRSIAFANEVSLAEWGKHRGVYGWKITPGEIAFSARFIHPAYERTCREFMDWIDDELEAAHRWSRNLPAGHADAAINLPIRVDRGRIGPDRDAATNRPKYDYADLEFSLSRDEIVKLLMTDKLYNNQSLFIRELLQNALDALRHLSAVYAADNKEPHGLKVEFEHTQEDTGFHTVVCRDNGIGMDAQIVRRFLTKAGRSYYRSPEFEQERVRFRRKDCDFDPCARFGIGFLSCFMFGDEITIRTRKDSGPGHAKGEPLVVEIAGLGNIITVRQGEPDQPTGTEVSIRSRKPISVFDVWTDPVNLCGVIQGYAIATEFPITARANVNQKHRQIEISTVTEAPKTDLDLAFAEVCSDTLTSDFSDADPRLNGAIRCTFLVDAQGNPAVENEDACWSKPTDKQRVDNSPNYRRSLIKKTDNKIIDSGERFFDYERRQIACDGILVAGNPGRGNEKKSHRLFRLGHVGIPDTFGGLAFLLYARGELKPELTPARRFPDSIFHNNEPRIVRLFKIAGRATGNLLHELAIRCSHGADRSIFWQLAEVESIHLEYLQARTVWSSLPLPFCTSDHVHWLTTSEAGPLTLSWQEKTFQVRTTDGALLSPTVEITQWHIKNRGIVTPDSLARLTMIDATITRNYTDQGAFTVHPSANSDSVSSMSVQEYMDHDSYENAIHFDPAIKKYICIAGPRGLINRDHPVSRRLIATQHVKWQDRSLIDRFCCWLTGWTASGGLLGANLNTKKPNLGLRRLGLLYRTINWSDIDDTLQPPYRFLSQDGSEYQLDAQRLESFSELPADVEDE
ncbi:MAG: hypothetical protein AAF710_00825 [Planctomycetota bacterium]